MDMFIAYKFILERHYVETEHSVGISSRVVLDLIHGLEGDGLELYTDNYYTSPELYNTLYKKRVKASEQQTQLS